MVDNSSNNKRIAKNSLYLYIRTFFTIFVSLYTSRIVLQQLGESDFGVYSVVGGLSVIFAFFSNALNVATQRFMTVEIGKGDSLGIKRVFTTCVNSHILIAIIIMLLTETFGLWLLNTQLSVPEDRMFAANVVFQLGLLTLVLGLFNVPYVAGIIAYEHMNYFAITGIINTVLKLLIVFLLAFGDFDKLIFYSILLFVVSVIKFFMDQLYCRIHFKNCKYIRFFDTNLFKTIFSFTGWNLLKMGAIIGVSQGNNILVNIFGGTIASAAMGLANRVNGTVYSFMQNVQTAYNPQITKTYSNNELNRYYSLTFDSAKFSSLMLLLCSLPLMLNMGFILHVWLGEFPEGTVSLCMVAIIACFLDSLVGPLGTGILAHGDIRNFQIISSILYAIAIPIAFMLLKLGYSVEFVLWAKVLSQILVCAYSLQFLKSHVDFPVGRYTFDVILKLSVLFAVCYYASISLMSFSGLTSGWLYLFFSSLLSWGVLLPSTWFLVFSNRERQALTHLVKTKIGLAAHDHTGNC